MEEKGRGGVEGGRMGGGGSHAVGGGKHDPQQVSISGGGRDRLMSVPICKLIEAG